MAAEISKPSAHSHPACDANCSDNEGHPSIDWTEWTATDSLPATAGNYYLADDVTLSSTWYAPGETKLCLNGHKITLADGVIYSPVIDIDDYYAQSPTINDCNGSGSSHTYVSPVNGTAKTVTDGLITGGTFGALLTYACSTAEDRTSTTLSILHLNGGTARIRSCSRRQRQHLCHHRGGHR